MKQYKFFWFFAAISFAILPLSANAQNDVFITNKRKIQPELSLQEVAQLLRPEILKIPSVRGIVYNVDIPNNIRIITSNSLDIRLDNFRSRLNARGADRPIETKKFIEIIAKAIAKSDPFKPNTLRFLIRTKEALDDFEQQTALDDTPNHLVRRTFIGDLEEVIVAETKSSIAFMPNNRLKDLGLDIDSAFKLAHEGFAENLKSVQWINQDGLMHAKLDGAFDTSILAIPEIWNSIEKQNGFPIAVIAPNRGILVIGRANNEEDLKKLNEIAKKEAIGPHALTDKILLWSAEKWEILK